MAHYQRLWHYCLCSAARMRTLVDQNAMKRQSEHARCTVKAGMCHYEPGHSHTAGVEQGPFIYWQNVLVVKVCRAMLIHVLIVWN